MHVRMVERLERELCKIGHVNKKKFVCSLVISMNRFSKARLDDLFQSLGFPDKKFYRAPHSDPQSYAPWHLALEAAPVRPLYIALLAEREWRVNDRRRKFDEYLINSRWPNSSSVTPSLTLSVSLPSQAVSLKSPIIALQERDSGNRVRKRIQFSRRKKTLI